MVKHETANVLTFTPAEYPATASGPYRLTTLCTNRLPTDTNDCCTIEGTATRTMFLNNLPSNSLNAPSSFLTRTKSSPLAKNAASPCAMKVAQATPATPMENAVTKSMSSPILRTEEKISR